MARWLSGERRTCPALEFTQGITYFEFTRSNSAQPLIVVRSPAAHYLMLFNPLTSHRMMFCDRGQTVDVVVMVVVVVVVVPK